MAICSCKRCGSNNVEFRREDAGFRKTVSGSRREHRTIGFCKDCGYTWVTDGPKFEKKPTSLASLIGIFILIMIGGMFIHGRINDIHKAIKKVDYEVTQNNISFVSNPSEQYIIDTLRGIDGVMEIVPATIGNDPNNLLSSEDGASCVVFFSYNKIDQSSISGDYLLDKGTDAGGCIEVFRNEADAKSRDKHLGIFGVSGSHVTIGTTIVRTSAKLSYKEQDVLESMICKALLKIEE